MTIIHVTRLSLKNSNGIKSVLTDLIPQQQKLGCLVYVFNLAYNNQAIFDTEVYIGKNLDFIKNVETIAPDLVVFHGGYELKFYLFAHFLRKRGVPYIIVPHGGTSRFNLKKKRILKTIVNTLFTKYFIKNSSGVCFLNENERRNSIFINDIQHYSIIPNGVHLHSFDYRIKLKSDKVQFIYLSRIDIKFKGLDILLRAIEHIHTKYPELDFDFHIYGGRYDPQVVENFKGLVAKTKAPVFYHGEVIGKDKEDAYLNANIYVLPSLSEGMPVTVLEALSYGNPCVVTPQTNMGDLIINHHAGWITQTDENCLADTLYRAYTDYLDNREMYVNCAFEAVKPYSWESIGKRSIQEYTYLIGKH